MISASAQRSRTGSAGWVGTPSPHAWVRVMKRLLLEQGAVFGTDADGRYCFRTMDTEDALYATLVMLRIASHLGDTLRPTLDRLEFWP